MARRQRNIEALAREIATLRERVNARGPQLAYSSIEDGAIDEHDADGNLVGRVGRQHDGSHGAYPFLGPVPPVPAGVSGTGGVGVYSAGWNGTFEHGAVATLDMTRVEVHESPVEPFFQPEILPESTTRVGSIESLGGGAVTVRAGAGKRWIRFVSRSATGKASVPSMPVEVEVTEAVSDEDIGRINDEIDRIEGVLDDARQEIADTGAELDQRLVDAEADLAEAADLIAALDEEVIIAATTAAVENLYVTDGAVINSAVIDKLWTDVVRSRKITTDMLLVGSGENYIPNGNLVGDVSDFFTLATGWEVTRDEYERQAIRYLLNSGSRTTERFPIAPGEYRFSVEARAEMENTSFSVSFLRSGWGGVYAVEDANIGATRFGSGRWDSDRWYTITGTLTIPDEEWSGDVSMRLFGNTQSTTGGWQEFRGFRLTSMTDASLIVDGAINADHIAANSITADEIAANSITADEIAANTITADEIAANTITVEELAAGTLSATHIEAGVLNAEIEIGTDGLLRVGPESGIHVKIADGKIESLRPGETGPQPAVTMGGADSAFRVFNDDGEFAGGILPDGGMVTPSLDAEEIRIGGEDLSAMLDPRPKGVVVWSGFKDASRGSYTADRTGLYEVSFRAEGGRRYRLHFEARARTQNDAPYSDIGLTKTQTENLNEEAPAPLVTSPSFPGTTTLPQSGWFGPLSRSWVFSPSRTENARFLLWIGPNLQVRGFWMTVEDLGVNPENEGRYSLGGASGTKPDPTPPVQEYVTEIPFTDHQVWTQFGPGDTYAPQWVRHGISSGMIGVYRTYLLWPTEFRNILSSAQSIDRVEVRLGMVEGWGGHSIYTGLHNSSNISTSNEPTIYNAGRGPSWSHQGQNQWFDLTATQVSNIDAHRWNNRKGLVLGNKTSTPENISFYGPGASSARRPMLRVHYTQ